MMTEKEFFSPTLSEPGEEAEHTDFDPTKDDGDTIFRGVEYGETQFGDSDEQLLRTKAEKLHEEIVAHLTEIAEQLAR